MNWVSFLAGAAAAAFGLIGMVLVSDDYAHKLCAQQKWVGAACQCRITTGLDKKPTD